MFKKASWIELDAHYIRKRLPQQCIKRRLVFLWCAVNSITSQLIQFRNSFLVVVKNFYRIRVLDIFFKWLFKVDFATASPFKRNGKPLRRVRRHLCQNCQPADRGQEDYVNVPKINSLFLPMIPPTYTRDAPILIYQYK